MKGIRKLRTSTVATSATRKFRGVILDGMNSPSFPKVLQWLAVVAACGIGCVVGELSASAQDVVEKNRETYVLERVSPKSPQEAIESLEVVDGFRIEQVAAEPLVADPVAMAFDERGQLYVVEMCDYSEQDKERLGRIHVLTDDDGDGRFDRRRVFAENLSWPTAIACYDGGVFVGAAPDLLYLKDTDGDGVANEQKVVFTGFGRKNVQGLLNSFHWGLDHRIHGSTSTVGGGQITRPGSDAPPVELQGRDFAFDPKTLEIEAKTGGGQHGMSFNRWGDRFVCHNSDHLQAIVFEERYIARNPYQSVASARRSIAADGPQATVFRISPVEAWRIARTKLRVAGLATGPIEGGGTPAGYFTSATGVTIYEGGLWDADGPEWAIVADVGSNLIHRKRLEADGVTYRGQRVDQDTEFVRSRDIWFRPVQFAIGPEGALYVADMYREVIEHPGSLPKELKEQLDLTSGRDRGRIYRIVPADYRQKKPVPLAEMGTAELVASLDDANQWRRMTALRLLYEKQDPAAAELLRGQFAKCRRPEGRIAVLYALDSVDTLSAADLLQGLADKHPQVRRHAVRLAEPMLDSSPEVRERVFALAADPDPVVLFQLALSLGECHDPHTAGAVAEVLRRGSGNLDIVAAALTSVSETAGPVLGALVADGKWTASQNAKPVLAALVFQIVKQKREADLAVLLDALSPANAAARPEVTGALLAALSRVPRDAAATGDSPQLVRLQQLRESAAESLVADARRVLASEGASVEQRVAAIENLGLDAFENQHEVFQSLLTLDEPAAIHAAVLKACAVFDSPEVAQMVLAQWEQLTPGERSQATELLLRRKAWALALLEYLSAQEVPLSTLDPSHLAQLVNYPADEVSKLARTLRGKTSSDDRLQVFKDYHDVISAAGDPAAGKLVFQKNCASCHEVAGTGTAVGPNLAAMVNRGRESLLFNVLVPNGEVDPKNFEYVLLTADGQFVTGIVAGETSTAVTLRGSENKTTTVLRVDIDEMHNTGKSLMPEGFEKLIDKHAMADLLAYLEQAATAGGKPK